MVDNLILHIIIVVSLDVIIIDIISTAWHLPLLSPDFLRLVPFDHGILLSVGYFSKVTIVIQHLIVDAIGVGHLVTIAYNAILIIFLIIL